MTVRLVLFALASLLGLVPLVAGAEPRTAKIAVLDARASGTADPRLVGGLDPLVAGEVSSRTTAQVTSGADLRAMIGFEKQKELMGCGDASCLAEIGGALGVDYLMAVDVSLVGGTWLVSTSIVEIGKARPLGRVTKRADSEQRLVDTAVLAVAEVIAFLPVELRREVKAAEPVAPTTVAPPAAVKPAPASERGSTVAPWLLFAGGLGCAGVGGWLLTDAWLVHGDYEQGVTTGAPTVTRAMADDATFGAQLGVGLLSGGAALVVLGTLLYPDDPELDEAESLRVTPTPGGLVATLPLP